MSQKRSNSGRMLSGLVALFAAGLIVASVAAATFMPDRQVTQRLSFPVASSTFPVGPGDTIADRVLGQMDFFHNSGNFVDASTLRLLFASQVAVDQSSNPNRIYVADFGNNRVLGWSSVAALANGSPANLVIGQPDLFSAIECTPGTTVASAASLCFPLGVAVDSSGNLYVADTHNNRVLEYNTPFTHTGMPGSGDAVADVVFGQQGSFTSSSCNLGGGPAASTTLCMPTGLAIDNTGVLYISDTGNSRVLEYDFPSIETAADDVFGQNGHFNGTLCNVSGRNPNTLCNPQGIGVDGAGNLYVADTSNSRVLEYNNPIANDTTADHLYGQGNNFSAGNCNGVGLGANSLCKPTGVALDAAGNLYVADQGNNRVLEYNMPLSNAGADKVFGQAGMAGNTPNYTGMVDAKGLWAPGGAALDSAGNLYVVDDTNSRVLEYDFALTSDTTADVVLGQPDFNHNSPNTIDASGYAEVSHIAIDNSQSTPRLWVADDQNDRVLGYNNAATFANGAPADVVVGQPDFFTGGINCAATPTSSNLCEPVAAAADSVGNLYVVDDSYNRVLKFLAPVNTGDAAVLVIGQPNFASRQCNGGLSTPTAKTLCNPQAVAVDALNNLWVADVDNHRVLEYPNPQSSNPIATHVFGQPGYITKDCNHGGSITAATLCRPLGVAVDSMGRLFIADDSNNRVLRYNTPLTKSNADLVYGQGAAGNNFSSGAANAGGIGPATLSSPEDVAIDIQGNLYVADFTNNRILHYAAGFGINTVSADTVFGQGGSFFSGQGNLGGSTPNAATVWGPRGLAVDKAGNLYSAELNNNRVLQYEAPFGAPSPTPTPGNATLSPTSIPFGNVATGDTSTIHQVKLTNPGAGSIVINAVSRGGATPTDFGQSNNCVGVLGGMKSCTINVSFTPMASPGMTETAILIVYGNFKNSPQKVSLSGTSALPATLTPGALNFGNVAVANTSVAQALKLSNNRSKASSVSLTIAGTNPGDFTKTTTCTATLAAFTSCTISVKFTPAALGARSAQLQAFVGGIAMPVVASLVGTGAAPATVTPSTLAFGNITKGTTSAAKLVTLINNRSAALTVSPISLGGTNPGDFLKTTTCGASLAAFAKCTVSVQFKPTAIGARSATLTVTDSPDSGSPHHVTLSGTGQ